MFKQTCGKSANILRTLHSKTCAYSSTGNYQTSKSVIQQVENRVVLPTSFHSHPQAFPQLISSKTPLLDRQFSPLSTIPTTYTTK